MNRLSGLNISQGAADFRLLDRKVVNVIRDMQEDNLLLEEWYLGWDLIKLELNMNLSKEHGANQNIP